MTFDLGIQGLAILIGCSLLFGAACQVVAWSRTHWMWLTAAIGWFVGGLLASEVVWGTLTVDEIQPIIDGLAFDESLLGGLLVGVPVAIATWFVAGGGMTHRTMTPPS